MKPNEHHHSNYSPNNLKENLIDLGIATVLLTGSIVYALSDNFRTPTQNPIPAPHHISEALYKCPNPIASYDS